MAYTQSKVVQIIGPRGSGKSLFLCCMGCRDLIRGRKVWSNMPVKLSLPMSRAFGVSRLSTIPLDWNAFYSLSADLADGTVLIDEAQYFSDSRSSISLKNRLLNAIVAQVRKRSLNLYYTVKQGDWVDRRLNYETDLQIECYDLAWSPWGGEHNLHHGEQIRCRMRDLSGSTTGTPYSKSQNVYRSNIFHGKRYWNCYDTKTVIDLEEGFTKVRLDLRERVISNKQSSGDVLNQLNDIASELVAKGETEISTAGFWNIAKSGGIDGSSQYLGRYLPQLGIERRQKRGGSYFYDLSKLGQGGLTRV